ncbi:MAG: beta-ketoacyl-ACP reductase [Acidimicrobiia bacterium]|nr:MAG: beta-ketoacyl-ACP reductase [Acidimicrobiia bacterium]
MRLGGIGRAIGDLLAARGALVCYVDIFEPTDIEVLQSSPRRRFALCDVTSEEEVDKAFTRVEHEWGTVSILVNNAGVLYLATLEDTDRGTWERTFAVNTTGAFLCAKRALPGMARQGYGRVITIGSSAGKTGGVSRVGAYAASKAAVMALAKTIASEYAAAGVTSNALAPALIETDMIAGSLDQFVDRIPVGRLGTP